MNTNKIIVLIAAILLIGFIIWWFFGKHQETAENANVTKGKQEADVVVNGGYSPSTIVLEKNVPAEVNFDLKDSTACLSHVVFDQLGVNKDLSKKDVTPVKIPTNKPGEYDFTCQMGMFHGKVVVK